MIRNVIQFSLQGSGKTLIQRKRTFVNHNMQTRKRKLSPKFRYRPTCITQPSSKYIFIRACVLTARGKKSPLLYIYTEMEYNSFGMKTTNLIAITLKICPRNERIPIIFSLFISHIQYIVPERKTLVRWIVYQSQPPVIQL